MMLLTREGIPTHRLERLIQSSASARYVLTEDIHTSLNAIRASDIFWQVRDATTWECRNIAEGQRSNHTFEVSKSLGDAVRIPILQTNQFADGRIVLLYGCYNLAGNFGGNRGR